MSAKKHSRLQQVAVATDGISGTYNNVVSVRDATMDAEKDMTDSTTRESGQNKEYLDGLKGATIKISCAWDESDAVLLSILDRLDSNATLHVRWRHDTAGGLRQYRSECKVMSASRGAPVNDLQTLDIGLQLTGAPTADTQ